MRNNKREQRLIRVITLLDGAELGQDREHIMNLLHSARRANRDGYTTGLLCFEAVRVLSTVSGRLQASGAAAETLDAVASATDLLLPDFVTEELSIYAMFMAEPPAWRLMVLSAPLLCAGLLYGLWRLLSA